MIYVGIDIAKDKHDGIYDDVWSKLTILLQYIISQ